MPTTRQIRYRVRRSNRLSLEIDEATTRPDDQIAEFNRLIQWLRHHEPTIDLADLVRAPQNW